jgi:hypothetical protein
MKHKKIGISVIVCIFAALLVLSVRHTMASAPPSQKNMQIQPASPTAGGGPGPVDNWFTYQGYLEDNGVPVNATCDFEFSLWDSSGSGVPPTGGTQIGVTETLPSLPVTDGLFSYPLNWSSSFGDDAFNGQRRYLQIAVRCPVNSGAYTTLAPRQHLTAAPYALSLRPGAIISATQNNALLTVINTFDSDTFGSAITARGSSTTAPVISAYHEGTGHALYGSSNSSYPTIGGVNYGSGTGVSGSSDSGIGVVGVQSGYSSSDNDAWKPGGLFGGANGVIGITKAISGRAVYGRDQSTTGGWAGYFVSNNGNGVYISAPNVGLNVAGGSKNAVVRTEDGSRLMYSEEATEVWFADYGFGQLEGGTAVIHIDPIYAQTVNMNKPYHIFLQAYDDAILYVTNRTPDSFEVHLREGSDTAEFSYRIVALRLGHEDTRMERAPWADNDPNLYPEKANEASAMPQGGQ